MIDYPRKHFYRDTAVAESYHKQRFTHRRGIARDRALRRAMDRAVKLLPDIRSVLDLPSGTGRFMTFFRDRQLSYFGVDISQEMLTVLARDHAGTNGPLKLTCCDGELLPFRDGAFDCVVSIRLFQLIPQEAKLQVLREMRRVSKRWLIVEHMYAPTMRDFGKARYLAYKLFRREREFPVLDQDTLDAGWNEYQRIPLRGMKNWIGIYCK